MTDPHRIVDKENVRLWNGDPWTFFVLLERRSHPVQGTCYVHTGRFAAEGHDATDHECVRAAMAVIHTED